LLSRPEIHYFCLRGKKLFGLLPKKPIHPVKCVKSRFLPFAIAIQTLLVAFAPTARGNFNISDTTGLLAANIPVGKNTKPEEYAKPVYSVKKVVIDAGHGGHDPGCIGSAVHEKEIALGIAQKLAAQFKATFPDVQVILTRNTDEFIPLHERAKIANRNAADLFISLHCNYVSKASQVHGSETYVLGPHKLEENLQVALRENSVVQLEKNYQSVYGYDPNSPEATIILSMYQNAYLEQSILFADKVEYEFTTASRHSRGVKQAGFLVLRETTMPSVLIETGFLSNRDEENYLRSDEGQNQIALAILTAFAGYKAEVEGTAPVQVVKVSEPEPEPKPETQPAPAPVLAQPVAATPVRESYATAPVTIQTPPSPPSAPATQPATANGMVFKVQLAASSGVLDTRSGKWTRLSYPVDIVPEGGMNKYQIPAPNGYWHAEEIRSQARTAGFEDAFIVVYQNGQKIPLPAAKQQLGIQ
jgi:N-acetylmuramoyl-L-alanine amidase